MMRWLLRLFRKKPPAVPRYDFAIRDSKLHEFDEPLTPWQAVARMDEKR